MPKEKMHYELLKVICVYVKQRKMVDAKFIEKVLTIAIENLELQDYVRNVEISSNPWKGNEEITAATYSSYSRKIKVELLCLLEYLNECQNDMNFSDSERIFFLYIKVTQVLLHELEHANQDKKVDKKGNDIETLILTICNKHHILLSKKEMFEKLKKEGCSDLDIARYFLQKQKRYQEYYEYAPHERLAEYYSHSDILGILTLLENKLPNLSLYEKFMYYQNFLRGYKETEVPTLSYLKQISTGNFPQKEIEEASTNLSLERKLSLGLEVAPNVIDRLDEETHELARILYS